MFEFSIVNVRSKKVVIGSISYQLNRPDDTIYSPIERYVAGKLTHLEFGERLCYEVRYNDFNKIDETDATKLRLIVRDTTDRVYKTKWIKIIRVPKS